MERPLLLPFLSATAGLCLAALYEIYFSPFPLIPLVILGGAALLLRRRAPFLLAASTIFFLWGNLAIQPYLLPQLPPSHVVNHAAPDPVVVEGVIDSRPENTPQGGRVYLRVEKVCTRAGYHPVVGRLLLFVGEGKVNLTTGDRVRFMTRLMKPRNFGLPGEYDYVRHLAFREVYVTGFVKAADDMLLMRRGVAFPVRRALDEVARVAAAAIDSAVPVPEASVLKALLLGDQGGVPRSLSDAYARSGVNHILSISGFHIAIISLVVFQLLFFIASRSTFLLLHLNLRRTALLLTLPVMVFYLFLTGAAPATVRSVIMLAAFIVALALERKSDPLDSLLLAAVAIVAVNPPAVFDISFQLSFLALWGLIVLTPLFMEPFRNISGWRNKALSFIAASAAATIATMLPVAMYFHRVSLSGLLANFLIVPLIGYGAVVLGFLALPFVWIWEPVAELLFQAAGMLVKAADGLILWFAQIPVITSIHPGRLELLLFFVFVLSITLVRPGWKRLASSVMSGGACVVFLAMAPFADSETLQVSVLSMGQAESILVKLPGGETMLVDGGGKPYSGTLKEGARDVGERLLAPALWSMGVRRIDYLVLSHPHPDHLQGLVHIAENFPIGEFWEGEASVDFDDYHRLSAALAKRQVPVRVLCAAAGPFKAGGAVIEPLLPSGDAKTVIAPDDDLNEQSLVFRLTVGNFSMLFTGDIGFSSEERLLRQPERLAATVLKVPHHGSRFSSSEPFVRAVSPETAVISAGYGNSFRLPAVDTLRLLAKNGVRTWRTDEDGTITISCDSGGGNCSVTGLYRQMH